MHLTLWYEASWQTSPSKSALSIRSASSKTYNHKQTPHLKKKIQENISEKNSRPRLRSQKKKVRILLGYFTSKLWPIFNLRVWCLILGCNPHDESDISHRINKAIKLSINHLTRNNIFNVLTKVKPVQHYILRKVQTNDIKHNWLEI